MFLRSNTLTIPYSVTASFDLLEQLSAVAFRFLDRPAFTLASSCIIFVVMSETQEARLSMSLFW